MAVILLGVVARGDVDAGRRAVVAHGNSSSGVGRRESKIRTWMPLAAMTPAASCAKSTPLSRQSRGRDYALGRRRLPRRRDHVREGLGHLPDDMHVHVVQAELHRAAQSGRAG